jgi:hypothetical protein
LYPTSKHSAGGGFGPVANPGVGVSYFIEDERVHVFVTAFGGPVTEASESDGAAYFVKLMGSALASMASLFA